MKDIRLNEIDIAPEKFDTENYQKIDYSGIHSEMSDIERRFVHGLIRYYEPQNIIEVGVAHGGGTVNILNAIRDRDSRCVSVDISETCWSDESHPIGFDVNIEHFGFNRSKWDLFAEKDPADVVEKLNVKYDFAVIDTAHLHPIESLNFLTILPYLNDGAVVCLHDTIAFCATVNRLFANRILMTCVRADKLEPQNSCEDVFAGNVFVKGLNVANLVAFQVTRDTRRYIRGVFDSLMFPWELYPANTAAMQEYVARHYHKELVEVFDKSVAFQKKYRLISLIGGLVISYVPYKWFSDWNGLGDTIVFYGAGQKMRELLQLSDEFGLHFEFPVWDIKAEEIGSIEGHKVLFPDYGKTVKETKLCVMIESDVVFAQVQSRMEPLGYKVFHGIRALIDYARNEDERKAKEANERGHFAKIVSNVDAFVEQFRSIPDDLIHDETYLEKFIIEKIGLNNEVLSEQPPELEQYYGKGLFIWQNPKQFSKYIVWLLENARNCSSYLEIGCHWGGTFIVICETLRRANPNFKWAITVDLTERTPFVERYAKIAQNSGFEIMYFRGSSTSKEFIDLINEKKPDISFIDGDHRIFGALQDHMLVREYSKIIIHHDISSDACPETTLLWNTLKELEYERSYVEFTDQYPSVSGKYLGIGILYK
jgi:predicted O-methyltransferase YrrM